jgi:hypothetical protein
MPVTQRKNREERRNGGADREESCPFSGSVSPFLPVDSCLIGIGLREKRELDMG